MSDSSVFCSLICAIHRLSAYPVNRQMPKKRQSVSDRRKELIKLNNHPYDSRQKAPMGFNRCAVSGIQTGTMSALPEKPVVTMAYVPFQTDTTTYDEMQALKAGTLFPVLDKPFKGRGMR